MIRRGWRWINVADATELSDLAAGYVALLRAFPSADRDVSSGGIAPLDQLISAVQSVSETWARSQRPAAPGDIAQVSNQLSIRSSNLKRPPKRRLPPAAIDRRPNAVAPWPLPLPLPPVLPPPTYLSNNGWVADQRANGASGMSEARDTVSTYHSSESDGGGGGGDGSREPGWAGGGEGEGRSITTADGAAHWAGADDGWLGGAIPDWDGSGSG